MPRLPPRPAPPVPHLLRGGRAARLADRAGGGPLGADGHRHSLGGVVHGHRGRRPGRVLLGPEAAESLAFAAFGDHGTREFFTHVRFHKHEEDRIVIHMLVELYARSSDEATDVLTDAARGDAHDHLTGRGVPPAGVEPRRVALAGDEHDTARGQALDLLAAAAELGEDLSRVLPSSGGVSGPRAWRPRSARPRARAGPPWGDRRCGWPGGPPPRPRRARPAPSAPCPRARRRRRDRGSHSSAERSRKRSWSSGTSTSRCSTRVAFVANRSSPASPSRPIAAHSARNSPSFAAATAIRPDDVSKSW